MPGFVEVDTAAPGSLGQAEAPSLREKWSTRPIEWYIFLMILH